MVINQYPLETKNEQIIMLPRGAEILSVGVIQKQIYLYALVDPNAPSEKRRIAVWRTYEQFEKKSSMKFIGSVYLHYRYMSCGLVFNIFELL